MDPGKKCTLPSTTKLVPLRPTKPDTADGSPCGCEISEVAAIENARGISGSANLSGLIGKVSSVSVALLKGAVSVTASEALEGAGAPGCAMEG